MNKSSVSDTDEAVPLNEDILKGAKQIAEYTGEDLRRVFHLLETGELPGFKRGGWWYSKKSRIDADVDERLAEAASRAKAKRKA